MKKKIMVVDDNITNLNIARSALENDYDVYLMPNGEKALKVFSKIAPDLVLLDVEMPELSGFDVIKEIHQMEVPLNETPIIFVTAKDDTSSECEGFNLGAVDYIIKPFSIPLLLKRVELHLKLSAQQTEIKNYTLNLENMVASQVETIKKLQNAIIHALGDLAERRDGSTGEHLIRTSEYLKVLLNTAKENNVYDGELNHISVEDYCNACKLHDIGKVSIPDHILLKPGKLTDEEYEVMKTHTTAGENAIEGTIKQVDDPRFLQIASEFIGTHHEKWDGTGYPRGLKGTEIPISGRLMAIADVYDALISTRPYKDPISHDKTLDIMFDGAGKHFDPVLMEVFKTISDEFQEISRKYHALIK